MQTSFRFPLRRNSRLPGAAIGLAVLAAAVGCAPKAAPPASPVTPAPVAPAVVSQTCPGPSDGPSIVANAVTEGHRAWLKDPATLLPPVCVLTAFAKVTTTVPDSVVAHALVLASEWRRRGPEQPALLAAEIQLLARMRRHADVSRSYDRLVAIDSQPALEISRLAIAAARQRADTATLLRILARTTANPTAGPSLTAEYNVLRQVSRLWGAVNDARGMLRQNPRYVAAYPSIITNFGTLGLPDSVIANLRRATTAGAQRAALVAAAEPLITTMLRHAALYGDAEGWDAPLAAAFRVDSALMSPSTKFLVAALIVYTAEARISESSALIGNTSLSRPTDQAARDAADRSRSAGCQRIAPLASLLGVAEARLREGGDRYAGGGVAQVAGGLSGARARLTSLQELCARPAGD